MVSFFIGLVLGGCFGVVWMAMCICAGESDRHIEAMQNRKDDDKYGEVTSENSECREIKGYPADFER